MKNSKLVEEAKSDPTRIYHRPVDVLRDRRLADPDRLEILTAWERSLRASASRNGHLANDLLELEKVRHEIEARSAGAAN